MKSTEVVAALGALAQESRLAVYHLLVKRGPEGYTPGELSSALGIPGPTLSFHLKELQHVGLVESRRAGRKLHYTADFTRMRALVAYLTEKCCSLADEACDTDCKPVSTTKKRNVA